MAIKVRTILMKRPEMGDMGMKGKRSEDGKNLWKNVLMDGEKGYLYS